MSLLVPPGLAVRYQHEIETGIYSNLNSSIGLDGTDHGECCLADSECRRLGSQTVNEVFRTLQIVGAPLFMPLPYIAPFKMRSSTTPKSGVPNLATGPRPSTAPKSSVLYPSFLPLIPNTLGYIEEPGGLMSRCHTCTVQEGGRRPCHKS